MQLLGYLFLITSIIDLFYVMLWVNRVFYTSLFDSLSTKCNFRSKWLYLSLFSFEMQRTPRRSNPDEELNVILPQTPVRYEFSYFSFFIIIVYSVLYRALDLSIYFIVYLYVCVINWVYRVHFMFQVFSSVCR